MPNGLFECGNPKCSMSIAITGLNKIQLQVLRRWAKTCSRCNQRTKWQEKLPLLNTKTTNLGGLPNANTNQTVPKSQSQKRKAARHDGLH